MISNTIQSILDGKDWSWSVIGFIVFVLGLMIRSLFLRNILYGMKLRDPEWYKRMLFYYEKRSILGWLCFGVVFIGSMVLWRFESDLIRYLNQLEWILVFLAFYIASLFLHIHAYASAIVETVGEHVASDKDL